MLVRLKKRIKLYFLRIIMYIFFKYFNCCVEFVIFFFEICYWLDDYFGLI